MKCNYCNETCLKKGFYKETQRYWCRLCNRYQQQSYKRLRITDSQKTQIIKLNNESVGISSIGRLLGISKSSVVRKIRHIAATLIKTAIKETNQEYEIDELHTYVRHKQNPVYIIYAINRSSRRVIDCVVGRRTKANITKVVASVNKLDPRKIFTDALNIYPGLISKDIHVNKENKINHIERMNLTLRTHLKRLNRKTICYTKSIEMLWACSQLYFGLARQ